MSGAWEKTLCPDSASRTWIEVRADEKGLLSTILLRASCRSASPGYLVERGGGGVAGRSACFLEAVASVEASSARAASRPPSAAALASLFRVVGMIRCPSDSFEVVTAGKVA